MATPPPPPSSEATQAAQVAMAAMVAAAIAKLWPSFLLNPARSLPAFKAAVAREVRNGAQASGALAQRQYRRQRAAAGETSTYRATLATMPSVEDIGALVDDALAGAGFDTRLDENAVAEAKARLARAAEDAVFDTGVRTVLENVRKDRAARGYARIPEADACSFCLLLAIRGAVFKRESWARSNAVKTDHKDIPSSIKAHDFCRCHPEAVFGVYEAPARVREAEQLYIDKARGSRLRFRQAVEGRLPSDDK